MERQGIKGAKGKCKCGVKKLGVKGATTGSKGMTLSGGCKGLVQKQGKRFDTPRVQMLDTKAGMMGATGRCKGKVQKLDVKGARAGRKGWTQRSMLEGC